MAPKRQATNPSQTTSPKKAKTKGLTKGEFISKAEVLEILLSREKDEDEEEASAVVASDDSDGHSSKGGASNFLLKFSVAPKEFSTGSLGWGYNGKLGLPLGKDVLTCQVSLNCTATGSKDWAAGEEAEERTSEASKPSEMGSAAEMTKKEFEKKAKNIRLDFGGRVMSLKPKLFSTGACGWFCSGKPKITVGEVEVLCQLSMNCTALKSKDWQAGETSEGEASGEEEEEYSEEEEEEEEEEDEEEEEEEEEEENEDGSAPVVQSNDSHVTNQSSSKEVEEGEGGRTGEGTEARA